MNKWLDFVAVVASFSTCIGFVGLFIKLGREKGAMDITVKEMRKDISSNETKLVTLDARVTQTQIENTKLISTLMSDLGWIKSSLNDIKNEMTRKKE